MSLIGFAEVRINELKLTLHDVSVHARNGSTWASPPGRAWIRDGKVALDERGKPQFSPLISFDTAQVRNAWSNAVIAAVREFCPSAFESTEGAA